MADKTLLEELGLGPEWQEVNRPPIVPGHPTGAPPSPNPMNPYFAGSIAPMLQHDKTFVDTKYGSPNIASYPLVPPGASAQAAVNAAVSSVIKNTVPTPVIPVTTSGMVFQGTWSSTKFYAINDVVIFNKSAYVALKSSIDSQPDGDNDPPQWQLLSENLLFNGSYPSPGNSGGYGTYDKNVISQGTGTTMSFGSTSPSGSFGNIALWGTANDGSVIAAPSGWTETGVPGFFAKVQSGNTAFSGTATVTSGSWASNALIFPFGGTSLTASVTSVKVVANVVTLTCANSFIAGTQLTIPSGALTNATFLNNNVVTLLTATATEVTFSFVHLNYGPASDSGTVYSSGIIQINAGSSGSLVGESITFTNPVKAGSTLLVVYFARLNSQTNYGTLTGATDSQGNGAYTIKNTLANPGGGLGMGGSVYYGFIQNAKAGATTITTTWTGFSITGASSYIIELAEGSETLPTFLPYDVVEFDGSMYVCLQETTDTPAMTPADWGLLGMVNPMTTLGDIIYEGASGPAALAGNTTTTKKFLTQTGTGSASAAPDWDVIAPADVPIGGVNSQTTSYLAVAGDYSKLISMNGSSLTLTLPATPPSTVWYIAVENVNATSLTIARNGLTIDGAASNLSLTQNQGVFIYTDGTNYFTSRGIGSNGTVTSVAMTGDGIIFNSSVGGSPITTSGTLVPALLTQMANRVLAGPVSGAAATPTFRALVAADILTAIASGTATLGTSAIASGAKATLVTVSAPGVLATDNVMADFSVDPTSTTGYAPSANGMLMIVKFCTADNVNFYVVNDTANSITPGAVTLNWKVIRQVSAAGTAALGTSSISSGAASSILTVPALGALTTDNVMVDFNADPTSTTGYAPSASGGLSIIKFCTAGNVNFYAVNNTGSSITPGAITLNWRIVRQVIASGSVALATSAISSGTKATLITVPAIGVLATDNLLADFNADPTSTTGYQPSVAGMLTIIKFCTAGNVNFYVINNTASSITPGAVTLNWRVVR